jgi:iron(III) transport system substrate-binding protein
LASRNLIIAVAVIIVIVVGGGYALISLDMAPSNEPSNQSTTSQMTSTTSTSTTDPEDFKVWQEGFNKKYADINIEYFSGRPGDIYTKITTEKSAGQKTADVVMITLPLQLRLQSDGLLETYRTPEAAAYPDIFKDPDGQWTAVILLPMVQAYNTEKVSAAEIPKTIDDLIDPKWAGRDVIHDITLGTTGTEYLATLKEPLGEDAWTSYIEGLANNVEPMRDASVSGQMRTVASGERDIGLNVYMHDLLKNKNSGAPVSLLRVEGLPILTSVVPVSLVTGAEHPIAAKLFIDFILSADGQEVVGNTEVRIAARPGVNAEYTLSTVLPGTNVDDLIMFPNKDTRDNVASYTDLFKQIFAS